MKPLYQTILVNGNPMPDGYKIQKKDIVTVIAHTRGAVPYDIHFHMGKHTFRTKKLKRKR